MSNQVFGLPLEYQKLPHYFDAHNVNEDTESKNAIIENLLKQHHVKTVLDLTCGTGSQVFFLTQRGYTVTGADFSPALLEIARKKALKENIEVAFIDGDMRTLQVASFDAVITIFNAVGHLEKADFEKAMRNVHHNLKDGGIYVFDILNSAAMTDKVVKDLAYFVHKKVDDTQILTTQCSTFDKSTSILTSYDSLMIQKNIEKPELFSNVFSLQLYAPHELKEMLNNNGFEVVNQYGFDGLDFKEDTTLSIVTVARKI